MNKLFNIFLKYKVIILITLVLSITSFASFKLYEEHSRVHVFVKFSKSGPLYKGMPVCFKGYEIGMTQEVTLSDNYKYTLVKVVLFPKNPKLPKDITAAVKKHDFLGNYIDLIAPDGPSTTLLQKGDIIDGIAMFDLGSFLSEIADSGLLIPLIQNFSDAALSLSDTGSKISGFFSDSRSVLKDNKQNLKHTTESLNKITSNLNTSFTKDKLNNTTLSINKSATNIQAASESIKNITRSVDCATRNLDNTVAKIDSTIAEAHATVTNAKVITSGFREVLGKRFAGLRLIFGKPLNNSNGTSNCSK